MLGVDIEMSEISRFLARTSLLKGKSVYISTSEGKVIAHSNASVVLLPDRAAGRRCPAVSGRFSELPRIEGRLADGVGKRLSEPVGTGSANVWEAEANGQHYFVAVGGICNKDWPWRVAVTVPKTGQLEPAFQEYLHPDRRHCFGHLACLCHRLRNEPGHRRADGPRLSPNAQLARKGNIELMEDVTSGPREIDKTDKILKELAAPTTSRTTFGGDGSIRQRKQRMMVAYYLCPIDHPGEAEAGPAEALPQLQSCRLRWTSSNSLACCSGVMPMPVSATAETRSTHVSFAPAAT